MFRTVVAISSLENAKKFVDVTSKYDTVKMRLKIDDYEVNAHSIVGVLSIVDSDKKAEFIADIKKEDEEQLSSLLSPFICS